MIKKFFVKFISDWKAETPKVWKYVRNISGIITTVMVVLSGISTTLPSVNTPSWFSSFGWYIAAFAAIITALSGKQKKL